jgi:hypothetical protein
MFQIKVVDKLKTRILYSIKFFRKTLPLRDNVEKFVTARQATDGNIISRMRFACWITKATDTHSEYAILIAFPRQQWLRERASMLRYTYISTENKSCSSNHFRYVSYQRRNWPLTSSFPVVCCLSVCLSICINYIFRE